MFNLENLRVLFVEDEETIRTNIKEAIGDEFLSFETACDGLDGLKKFKELNPDVVISDISMPNLDGLSMAKEIRKISQTVPILILSAYSEKEKLFQAIDTNINKYIVKPIDIDELLGAISDITNRDNVVNKIILTHGYSYDDDKKELYLNDKFISLTKKELLFIDLLVQYKSSYAKNDDIYKYVWANNTADTTVRTFVQRLRSKTKKELILNVSGLGYKLQLA